jgi:Acyl-CoA carboxylase epsilon subunit
VSGLTSGAQNGARPRDQLPLRILRGIPTPEEIAALTVVLAALQSEGADTDVAELRLPLQRTDAPRGRWNDPARRLRGPILVGTGGWRSAL